MSRLISAWAALDVPEVRGEGGREAGRLAGWLAAPGIIHHPSSTTSFGVRCHHNKCVCV